MWDSPIRAVQISDIQRDLFALFASDGSLYLWDMGAHKTKRLAVLAELAAEQHLIQLHYYHPYICVSQRFGLQAAVVDVRDGRTQFFSRADYHADVSSYSLGFVTRGGCTLLLHQTQWNRLDLTDLETGRLLTEREVWIREVRPGYRNEEGAWVARECAYSHYLDYFHSLLHISPDRQSFLSNGWVWGPMDRIRCFSLEGFLQSYELSSTGVVYGSGYNWDRPCAFLDNDRFVIATDDNTDDLDAEELREYEYHQLQFYRLSDIGSNRWLAPYHTVNCDVFPRNDCGEISGELHFDTNTQQLIALSENGVYILALDGSVNRHNAELAPAPLGPFHKKQVPPCWTYSGEHRLFYRCIPEQQQIELRTLEEV